MNLEELRDWVRRKLGAPVIRVELTDEQINDAYNTAVDKYLYFRRPREDYYYFQTTPGQVAYGPPDEFVTYEESVQSLSDLPTDNTLGDVGYVRNETKYYEWAYDEMISSKSYWKLLDPDPTGTPDVIADTFLGLPQDNKANDVREVFAEDAQYVWSDEGNPGVYSWQLFDQASSVPLDVLSTVREIVYQPTLDIINQLIQSQSDFFLAYYYRRSGGMYVADLWIAAAAKEDFNLVLGLQPTWEVLNNKLYLYPEPQAVLKVGVKYMVIPTEEELASEEWVTKATLALSKQTLGMVRRKYSSIPGPAGEGISLDGQILLDEGKAEWEFLLNDAVQRGEPLSFSVG